MRAASELSRRVRTVKPTTNYCKPGTHAKTGVPAAVHVRSSLMQSGMNWSSTAFAFQLLTILVDEGDGGSGG